MTGRPLAVAEFATSSRICVRLAISSVSICAAFFSGDEAFWVIQGLEGESSIDNVAMQGTNKIVELHTGSSRNNTAQAGPGSLSDMNGPPGISGANPYGNWSYQGTPGVSDAWSPANANMRNGVPTMPAATNGMNPPTMPR